MNNLTNFTNVPTVVFTNAFILLVDKRLKFYKQQ